MAKKDRIEIDAEKLIPITSSQQNLENQLWSNNINAKIEWTVIFVREFGRRHNLTLKQAFNYLLRYKGISFAERHYDYMHTQSFASAVDDITEYCPKMGGGIA